MTSGLYLQKIYHLSCVKPTAPGLGEGCTHIAGLLFAVEDAKTNAINDDEPCTSKPCEWNKPSKRKHEPTSIDRISFKKIKYGCENLRPQRKCDYGISKNGDEFLTAMCNKLGSSNAVLFDLLPPVDQTEMDIKSDINMAHWEEVQTSEYIIFESDKFIDIKSTVVEESIDTETKFLQLVSDMPTSMIHEIEERTRGQNENELWVKSRQFRITSSNFHDVLVRKSTTDPSVLVRKFSGVNSETYIQTAAMKWGREREPIAKKKYIAYMRLKKRERLSVKNCGIYLSDKMCYLGASPDGLVSSDIKQSLLEIKCPYKWRNSTVRDACKDKSFYCYIDDENNIKLKKTHRYFTQIQGQIVA